MNNVQTVVYGEWKRTNPSAAVVEEPCIMHNETFGDVAYFTAQYGRTFIEYGIKPNGDIFTVR